MMTMWNVGLWLRHPSMMWTLLVCRVLNLVPDRAIRWFPEWALWFARRAYERKKAYAQAVNDEADRRGIG